MVFKKIDCKVKPQSKATVKRIRQNAAIKTTTEFKKFNVYAYFEQAYLS